MSIWQNEWASLVNGNSYNFGKRPTGYYIDNLDLALRSCAGASIKEVTIEGGPEDILWLDQTQNQKKESENYIMKKTIQTPQYVTCTNIKRHKTYEVSEAKEKPGWAICPACGNYHRVKKEQ